MNTFKRILQFAPLQRFIAPFFTFSFLASVFNILTFTLIQTLLDVLFVTEPKIKVPHQSTGIMSWVNGFNNFIDNYTIQNGKLGTLWLVCGIIILCVLVSNVFRYLSARMVETVKGFTVLSLRKTIFEKALNLELGYFNAQRKGDIISRLTTDIQEVENSVGKAFSAIFKDVVLLIIYFIVLFWRSWQLTLFSLLIIPLSGIVIGSLTKKLKEKAADVQQNQSNLMSLFDEVFGGIRVIKGFAAEPFINKKFNEDNKAYYRSWLKMVFRQEAAPPISEILGVTLVATIMLFGGTMVLAQDSTMSSSAFVAYVLLYSQVTRPAKEISNAFAGIQRGTVAAERILAVIDTPIQITDAPNAIEKTTLTQGISFKNISFAYENGTSVLQDISFDIPKGKTVALVGSSGSGKSTIADLLPRFYEPTSGQITIDGIDIQQIKTKNLRQMMGLVAQENILFNDTIQNNITFGAEASTEQVMAAATVANAHQFILNTENGYQTSIGDRGSKLSGGQRQRLSIARAVLRNPQILILDEATSALDNESEQLVQESLKNLMKDRTTLVIAHRLSTIQHADEILVLKKGRIVERGTHQALMANTAGHYYKLNQKQEQS